MKKQCAKCKQTKFVVEFWRDISKKDKRNCQCAKCCCERKKNTRRKEQLKSRWGMTPLGYNRRLSKQNGVCAICGEKPDKDRNLAIDHCHKTKKIRGLLCLNCNLGLGNFKDNLDILASAVSYVINAKSKV